MLSIDEIKAIRDNIKKTYDAIEDSGHKSRAASLVVTKLQEAEMWAGKLFNDTEEGQGHDGEARKDKV